MHKIITILVVDDDKVIREYYEKIFPWHECSIRCIGTASNGLEALEICRKRQPDLILSDITMPEMDGLSLIKRLPEVAPFTRIVLLTCHQDFSFIQEALRAGVLDYIVKSLTTPEDMIHKFQEVYSRIIIERNRDKFVTAKRQFFKQLALNDYNTFQNDSECLIKNNIVLYRLTQLNDKNRFVILHCRIDIDLFKADLSLIVPSVLDQSEDILDCWVELPSADFLLLFHENMDLNNIKEYHSILYKRINNNSVGNSKIEVLLGVSQAYRGIDNIHKASDEAVSALNRAFYQRNVKVFLYDTPWSRIEHSELEESSNITVSDNTTDPFNHYLLMIDNFIEEGEKQRIHPLDVKNIIIALLNRLSFQFRTNLDFDWAIPLWPLQVTPLESSEEVKLWAQTKLKEILIERHVLSVRPEINRVLEALRLHFTEDIDLRWAADIAHLHPNYFSTLFTQEIGQTFSEYLQSLRINKASSYISEKIWPLQQVAEMVGFHSYRTFFNTFKRLTGMSPSDFPLLNSIEST
jgi:two-component system response regulator YesN